jgi:hypothetical protein
VNEHEIDELALAIARELRLRRMHRADDDSAPRSEEPRDEAGELDFDD